MKTIIFLFVSVILSTGTFAQNTPKTTKPAAAPSGVLKKGNTVWIVKPMQDNQTMDNGLTVRPNGNVKTASGKVLPLSDGDCIGQDGKMVGLNEKNVKTALVKQGKMWVATRVEQTVTLSNGTTVLPNGTVKKADGTIVPLKNDEIVDLSSTE